MIGSQLTCWEDIENIFSTYLIWYKLKETPYIFLKGHRRYWRLQIQKRDGNRENTDEKNIKRKMVRGHVNMVLFISSYLYTNMIQIIPGYIKNATVHNFESENGFLVRKKNMGRNFKTILKCTAVYFDQHSWEKRNQYIIIHFLRSFCICTHRIEFVYGK